MLSVEGSVEDLLCSGKGSDNGSRSGSELLLGFGGEAGQTAEVWGCGEGSQSSLSGEKRKQGQIFERGEGWERAGEVGLFVERSGDGSRQGSSSSGSSGGGEWGGGFNAGMVKRNVARLVCACVVCVCVLMCTSECVSVAALAELRVRLCG